MTADARNIIVATIACICVLTSYITPAHAVDWVGKIRVRAIAEIDSGNALPATNATIQAFVQGNKEAYNKATADDEGIAHLPYPSVYQNPVTVVLEGSVSLPQGEFSGRIEKEVDQTRHIIGVVLILTKGEKQDNKQIVTPSQPPPSRGRQ